MRNAVDLNGKPQLRAIEVENVIANTELTAKLDVKDLAALQIRPESAFGTGGMVSEVAPIRIL